MTPLPISLAAVFLGRGSGFSFEAEGRTFCLVFRHSLSGTLKPIFEGFFIFSGVLFIIIIFFT